MNRSEARDMAFKYLYQIEIQKEDNKESINLFFENKTHGADHCPTSCGRILQHSSCPAA